MLALYIWVPLARLTYSAYLVHPIIIKLLGANEHAYYHFSYVSILEVSTQRQKQRQRQRQRQRGRSAVVSAPTPQGPRPSSRGATRKTLIWLD